MKKISFLLLIILLGGNLVYSAVIEPRLDYKEIKRGEYVTIPIYLDTQFEEINAVEVYVNFSDNLVFRDYLDGKSIITHWLEKPHYQSRDVGRHEIVLSGIVAGGISGRNLNLVELIFEAKESGMAKIEIDKNSKVLLNDGLGTQTKLTYLSQSFNILDIKGKPEIKIKDIFPPEPFKIYLAQNKEIFNGKYYITFETKDKQSGIAYYEISEKPTNFIFLAKPDLENLNFKKAESPYILEDQSLRSYIVVRAVDKAGNERIEILPPQRIIIYDDLILLLVCLLVLTILILKFRYSYETFKNKIFET